MPKFTTDWYDYGRYYDEIADSLTDKSTFIEIGCWEGRSIIDLATLCKLKGKKPKIYAVDVWADCVKEETQLNIIKELGGSNKLYQRFLDNCNEAGVGDIIWPIRSSSSRASTFFNDNSVDIIFIDAGHTYEEVCQDILDWFRVVKIGGILSGHDYDSEPVIKAVHDTLGKKNITEKSGHVWKFIKDK